MAKVILKSYIKSIHGRLNNTIYYNRNGCQYSRSYTPPANPETALQQRNRMSFAGAVKLWQSLPEKEKSVYNRIAEGKSPSGYNIFVSMKLKGLNLRILKQGFKREVKINLISDRRSVRSTSVYPSPRLRRGIVYLHRREVSGHKPPGLIPIAA